MALASIETLFSGGWLKLRGSRRSVECASLVSPGTAAQDVASGPAGIKLAVRDKCWS